MTAHAITTPGTKPATDTGFNVPFIIAWLFCLLFYFMEYAARSAPSVMLPELTRAFGLTTVGLSLLIGLYYYTYAAFSILAGASVDRWGAKYIVPAGVLLLAVGAVMFGLNVSWMASLGRLLQGAGSAFAFIAAVYLASHGFPARYLATAIGITQCAGMLGGAAGQFVVASLIHGPIVWEQFWIYAGLIIAVIAVAIFIATPREDRSTASATSIWSTFAPYKTVLTNPQSYLCGLCGGLLFLPTTVGAMTWGVSFLENGWHLGFGEAADRAAVVAMGWVFGCPIMGYVADRIGRRKPVILGGAALMLAATSAIYYLPPQTFPPYVLGFLLGFGSGAAMIPYSVIKESNPDYAKGSAIGAMNFMVFVMSALIGPVVGWWLQRLSGGATFTLDVFRTAGIVYVAAIVLAAVLTLFLKETGTAARKAH
jgi:MFS family permease